MLLIHRRDVSREELHTWKDPDGRSWERNLSPLIQAIGQRYRDFLPRQTYPIRTGVHPNTAFGITFATVYHKDSLGNSGTLGSGDIQWMTAGSAILHQEMPRGNEQGKMHGFQLWANLPSSLKMTDPRYQDIPGSEIPEVIDADGAKVRVICGSFWGKSGPVEGIAADPRYLDV